MNPQCEYGLLLPMLRQFLVLRLRQGHSIPIAN
jgi:hypothetical protein